MKFSENFMKTPWKFWENRQKMLWKFLEGNIDFIWSKSEVDLQSIWNWISFISVTCNEFIVLNTPKSIEFKGTSEIPAESLSEVLAATLGYSVQTSKIWDGLFVNDPFNTAKSVVTIVVEGGENLKFKVNNENELYDDFLSISWSQNSKSFNIDGDESNFEDDLLTKVSEHSHLAIDVNLVDKLDEEVATPYGELKQSKLEDDVKFLKPKTNKDDKEFLNQIAYLQSLIKMVRHWKFSRDSYRLQLDNFYFQFNEEKERPTALNIRLSLKFLSGKHSESSAAASEAVKLLTSTIEKLNTAVEKVFNGNAVVTVITLAERHIRARRQAPGETVSSWTFSVIQGVDKIFLISGLQLGRAHFSKLSSSL